MRGTAASTIDNLRSLVAEHRGPEGRRLVLFVDYLQKVPVIPEPTEEAEKVTRIVGGLKDIALALEIPVVAIVAADREGLKAKRLRTSCVAAAPSTTERHHPVLNDRTTSSPRSTSVQSTTQRYRDWVVAVEEPRQPGQCRPGVRSCSGCCYPTGRVTARSSSGASSVVNRVAEASVDPYHLQVSPRPGRSAARRQLGAMKYPDRIIRCSRR
jgi:hypothetical protein